MSSNPALAPVAAAASSSSSSSSSSLHVDFTDDGSAEHILASVESAGEDGCESAFAAFFSLVYPDHVNVLAKWKYRHIKRLYVAIFSGYADYKGPPVGDGSTIVMRDEILRWVDQSPEAKEQEQEQKQEQVEKAMEIDGDEEEQAATGSIPRGGAGVSLRSSPSRSAVPPARPLMRTHPLVAPAASLSGSSSVPLNQPSGRDAALALLDKLPPVVLEKHKKKGNGRKRRKQEKKRKKKLKDKKKYYSSSSSSESSSSDSDSSSSDSSSSSTSSDSDSDSDSDDGYHLKHHLASHGQERIASHVIRQANGQLYKSYKIEHISTLE